MTRLAVVPGNTLDDLADKGLSERLAGYYNPQSFFEKVVFLSPFEDAVREVAGMRVVPTRDVELPARLKEEGADIVRAYGGTTPAEMAVFHRRAGVPVVVSLHDKRPDRIRPAVRFADAVFVVSQELRSEMVMFGIDPERMFVVPNGVDTALMRPLAAGETGELCARFPWRRKLLQVGRKSPEKNIESLVRALARLGPDYGLVSVGQGDAAPYEALAREAGVEGRCVFLPAVPQADLVRFYNWADCVCHPSRSEAMCNVLLEALACGSPVVTTLAAATGLGVGPDGAALLVDDPENDEVLAKRIRFACEEENVVRTLRAGARESVEHLSLERTQAYEAECYRQVLEMNSKGAFRRGRFGDVELYLADLWRRVSRRMKGR
ncbi:MAG: glycosyltransferase family 4 protein [Candidatus Omnitrophica bacterium]|nr:glycosyltransferase family 4 protein [Candidatus Omnitrophota bacterium]